MFVNADMLFHFLGAFCDWGSFIALAVGFGFVAEVNVRASAALLTVRFYVGGRTLRWAFVPISFGLWDLGINGGPTL